MIDGPINRDLFDLCIETRLAPTGQPGDVNILDNLPGHKSSKATQVLRDIGCWFLPLPPYSPDPGSPLLSQGQAPGQAPGQAQNPIEIIRAFTRTNGVYPLKFARLKALLRKAAARTCPDRWKAVGTVCPEPSVTASPDKSVPTTSSPQDTNPDEPETLAYVLALFVELPSQGSLLRQVKVSRKFLCGANREWYAGQSRAEAVGPTRWRMPIGRPSCPCH